MSAMDQILIVDDDPNLRRTMVDILQIKGFDTVGVGSGLDALRYIEENEPAVLILDIRLGDMSGMDVLREIKRKNPRIECILLTGHGSEEIAMAAMNAGAYSYLRKPLDIEQFLILLNRAIERRKAALMLWESEHRYRTLTEATPVGIFRTDAQGMTIYVNSYWCTLTGLQPEEALGNGWIQLVHPDMRESVLQNWQRAVENREISEAEYRFSRPGGEVWVMGKAVPELDEKGNLIGYIGTIVDITERRQSEENLRKWAQIFEHAEWGMFTGSADGERIELANPAFARQRGYSTEEMLAVKIRDLFAERFRDELAMHIQRVHRDGTHAWESVHVRKDGSEFPVQINATAVKNTDGSVAYRIVNVIDITERKLAENALRNSEAQYRLLFDHNPLPMLVYDVPSLKIIAVNDAAIQHYGYSRNEFLEMTVEQLHESEKRAALLERMNAPCELCKLGVWQHQRKDGSWIDVDITTHSIQFDGKPACLALLTDVTEQRKAEASIRYQANLLNAVSDAIIATDTDFIIKSWNKAAERIYGWTESEALGRKVYELIPTAYLSQTDDEVLAHFFQNGIWIGEVKQTPQSGELKYILSSVTLQHDRNGKPIGAVAVNRDITERKRAEEAIRTMEHRAQALIEHSPDGILLVGEKGEVLFASPSASRILESSDSSKLEINDLRNYIHPEDLEAVTAAYEHVLQSPGLSVTLQFRFNATKQQTLWLESTFANFLGDGSVDAAVINFRDITEMKQAEQNLQQQIGHLTALREIDLGITSNFSLDTNLEQIVHHAKKELEVDAACVLLLNSETNTLETEAAVGFQTPGFLERTISLGDELAGCWAMDRKVVHIPDLRTCQTCDFSRSLIESERFVTCYCTPLIAKGNLKGVFQVFTREPFCPREGWVDFLNTLAGQAAIAIDNAQLFERLQATNADLERRIEERTADLREVNGELERALRVKDEFLANMSHELRTPLNSVIGLSESLMERTAGELNQKQDTYLQTIRESGQHLLDMINDILDLAKIEAGHIVLSKEDINVEAVCQSSIRMVRQLAQKKEQHIQFEFDAEVGAAHLDARRLKQMLVNLLVNAIKFTPEKMNLGLMVRGDRENNEVKFIVWDQGIGIDKQDLPLLFQPFVQLDSNLARRSSGTGLGLSLVAKMTALHGGRVDVDSEVGKGSRFTIVLPWREKSLKTIQTEEQNIDVQEIIQVNHNLSSTILLADDTYEVALMIQDYLQFLGYTVVTASNGLEAVAFVEASPPNLILMDIQMPEMDGLEASRKIRKNPAYDHIPIIALTALAMKGDRERCLEAGMDGYISKPINLSKLVGIIHPLLLKSSGWRSDHPDAA